jgi:hypothetical protein
VAERSGRVRLIRDGRLLPRPFLDLRAAVEIRSPSIARGRIYAVSILGPVYRLDPAR